MPGLSSRPGPDEYAAPFEGYVRLVPEGDIVPFLEEQLRRTETLLRPLTEAQALTVHSPHTWTLKQVLGHVTDGERVFGYRALRLGRNDPTPLPGFDESLFMQFSNFDACPMSELIDEFSLVRRGHLLLFKHLLPEAWTRRGNVVGHPATCRALAYVMAGHAEHHLAIVKKRLGG